jgi:hypothetical protein
VNRASYLLTMGDGSPLIFSSREAPNDVSSSSWQIGTIYIIHPVRMPFDIYKLASNSK